MKTSTLLVATLLGLAIVSTQAQTQSSTTTTYVQASKIVGMKVNDSSGQEVGVVNDVVLDRNTGCIAYTVLSTGGTGTRAAGGTKTVAVPWTVYTATSDLSVMTVRVERDRVYNAPAFDYARIDEYSSSGYINNIYSYYGVTPGAGVGVGASTTTGTTTAGTYGAQTGVAGQATNYRFTGSHCLSGSHGNGLANCDCGNFTGPLAQSDRFANGNSESYSHIDSVAASDRNAFFRGGVDRRAQKPSSRRK